MTDETGETWALTERTREGGRNVEMQKEVAYALDNPGDGGRAQTRLILTVSPEPRPHWLWAPSFLALAAWTLALLEQASGTPSSARSMSTGEPSWLPDGPESPSTKTYAVLANQASGWSGVQVEEDLAMPLDGDGRQFVTEPKTFVRATKPHGARGGPKDDERWEESEVTPPLTPHGQGTVDPALVVSEEETGSLNPWDSVRMRVHGDDLHPPLLAGGRGPRGHSLPNILISSAEDSPAKTSPSPASEPDSVATGPDSSSSSPESLSLFDPDGFSSRTYPVSSLQTAVGTSESSLERWPTSGTAWPGGLSTHVSSECRSDGDGCSSSEPSLTEILEPPQNVPARYSLSARAAGGILRRAQKRGRDLPEHLHRALTIAAHSKGESGTGEAGQPQPRKPPKET